MPTITLSAADGGYQFVQQLFVANYASVAVAALITYEFILVMKEEFKLISDHRTTPVIYILLSQISLMATAIIDVLLILPASDPTSCAVLSITYRISLVIMFIVSAIVAASRVYAVSGKNWCFVIPTILLGLVPAGINIFAWSKSLFNIVVQVSSITTCVVDAINISVVTLNRLEIVTRACAIASDVIVVIVTWVNIYNCYFEMVQAILLYFLS